MKTNEFRIGNKFTDATRFEFTVSGMLCDTVYGDFEGNKSGVFEFDINEIKPIELTEDWLPKFGFLCETIKGNQNEFKVFTKGKFVFNTNHGWWIDGKQIKVQPKYVHQLQNLYFALTGEELELNP